MKTITIREAKGGFIVEVFDVKSSPTTIEHIAVDTEQLIKLVRHALEYRERTKDVSVGTYADGRPG